MILVSAQGPNPSFVPFWGTFIQFWGLIRTGAWTWTRTRANIVLTTLPYTKYTQDYRLYTRNKTRKLVENLVYYFCLNNVSINGDNFNYLLLL